MAAQVAESPGGHNFAVGSRAEQRRIPASGQHSIIRFAAARIIWASFFVPGVLAWRPTLSGAGLNAYERRS